MFVLTIILPLFLGILLMALIAARGAFASEPIDPMTENEREKQEAWLREIEADILIDIDIAELRKERGNDK